MERAYSDEEIAKLTLIYNIPQRHTEILRKIPKRKQNSAYWIGVLMIMPFAAVPALFFLVPRLALLAPDWINIVAAAAFPPQDVTAPFLYQGSAVAILFLSVIVTFIAAVWLGMFLFLRRPGSDHERLIFLARNVVEDMRMPKFGCLFSASLFLMNFLRLSAQDVADASHHQSTEAFYKALQNKRRRNGATVLVVIMLPLLFLSAANAFAYRTVTPQQITERPSFSLATYTRAWSDVERIDSGCEHRGRGRIRHSYSWRPYYRLLFSDGTTINLTSQGTIGIGADVVDQLLAIDDLAEERDIPRTVNGAEAGLPPGAIDLLPPEVNVNVVFRDTRCKDSIVFRFGEERGNRLAEALHISLDDRPTAPAD